MNFAAARDRDEYAKLVTFLAAWMAGNRQSTDTLRTAMDGAQESIALPEGMTSTPWIRDNLAGQMIAGASTRHDRVMLYLHGGGYHYGSSRSHRHLAAAIAQRAGCDTLVLDYRRAPEHVYPAALDDALDAYTALLETWPAERIAIAGDSAGGGLAIALAMKARDKGLPVPGALACMSPWLDMTCRDLTDAEARRTDDPIVSMQEMRDYAASYLAGADPRDPGASPLHGALHDLPPIYLQAGGRELVARDTLAFAATCTGTVTVELQADAPHVWQWFWPRMGTARRAVDRLGRFLDEHFE